MKSRKHQDAAGDPRSWVTKEVLRFVLGLSESQIDRLRREFQTPEQPGRPLRIHGPKFCAKWAAYESANDDEVGDSEWLEERRKWQALRERNRYEQEMGVLMPIDDVQRGYALVAGTYRTASETLCPCCKDKIEQALDDAEVRMKEEFGGEPSDDEPVGEDDEA
jgi:hypothetical protein